MGIWLCICCDATLICPFDVEQLQRLKEWDAIFPIVPDSDKEVPHAHEYAEELWEQLDHLG